MRPQKVSVDVLKMIFSSCSYLALAFAAWVFVKLLYACFWLPGHLKKERLKEDMENNQQNIDVVQEVKDAENDKKND